MVIFKIPYIIFYLPNRIKGFSFYRKNYYLMNYSNLQLFFFFKITYVLVSEIETLMENNINLYSDYKKLKNYQVGIY